ncbi:hypothetical protein CHS0354_014257, partial [Potamilus streckersoni]
QELYLKLIIMHAKIHNALIIQENTQVKETTGTKKNTRTEPKPFLLSWSSF